MPTSGPIASPGLISSTLGSGLLLLCLGCQAQHSAEAPINTIEPPTSGPGSNPSAAYPLPEPFPYPEPREPEETEITPAPTPTTVDLDLVKQIESLPAGLSLEGLEGLCLEHPELTAFDMDGDGSSEVLARGSCEGELRLLLFAALDRRQPLRVVASLAGAHLLDLDDDGGLEAAWARPNGGWRIGRWRGGGWGEENAEPSPRNDLANVPSDSAWPSLPSDLLVRHEHNAGMSRWPASGGSLTPIPESDPLYLDWPWPPSSFLERERDLEAGIEVRISSEDDVGMARVKVDPTSLPAGAQAEGSIEWRGPGAGPDWQPLIALQSVRFDEYGRVDRGSRSLLLSKDADRLYWSDGAGLWELQMPDGPVRRLTEPSDPYGMRSEFGFDAPLSMSPDGRHLLTWLAFHIEARGYALWDLERGHQTVLIDTSCGHTCQIREMRWVNDRLLFVSQDYDMGPRFFEISPTAPEVESWTTRWHLQPTRMDPIEATYLPVTVFDATIAEDGSLIAAIASAFDFGALKAGIYRVALDHHHAERIVDLPPLASFGPSSDYWWPPPFALAPDGSAFAFTAAVAGTSGELETRAYLGLTETGQIWHAPQLDESLGFAFAEAPAP